MSMYNFKKSVEYAASPEIFQTSSAGPHVIITDLQQVPLVLAIYKSQMKTCCSMVFKRGITNPCPEEPVDTSTILALFERLTQTGWEVSLQTNTHQLNQNTVAPPYHPWVLTVWDLN